MCLKHRPGYVNVLAHDMHTKTHTHYTNTHQAAPQTRESSLISINIKESRGKFVPLTVVKFVLWRPQYTLVPLHHAAVSTHLTGDYQFKYNRYLCHQEKLSSQLLKKLSTEKYLNSLRLGTTDLTPSVRQMSGLWSHPPMHPYLEIISIGLQLLLDALDLMVIAKGSSLYSVLPSPCDLFWFSAGQISQIKTHNACR